MLRIRSLSGNLAPALGAELPGPRRTASFPSGPAEDHRRSVKIAGGFVDQAAIDAVKFAHDCSCA
jgi:hypothetical protein